MADPLFRRLRLARLALWWERAAPLVTALWSLLALVLALALFDGAPLLPGWLHALILAGFAAAFAAMLRGLFRLPRPTATEAARRLERQSGAAHRPLAALADTAATGDAGLWRLHRDRMAALARTLRPGWPGPVLPARDPYGLRFAALLLLVIAAAGSGADWRDRLGRAFNPQLSLPGLGPSTLEVWITPPAYTGLATQVLRPDSPRQTLLTPETSLAIAEGSRIKAVLAGGWGTARLETGSRTIAFQRDPSGSQRIEAGIEFGPRLALTQGWRDIASWPVTVIRDAPPSIAFTAQPEGDPRGRLLVTLEASDDYGLAKAWIEVQRLDGTAGEAGPRLDLPLPGDRLKSATLTGRFDLAAHDWAGLPVRLIPRAEDGAGQIGAGEPTIVTLPERLFRHPVARSLIQWRKEVGDTPDLDREVAERLRRLSAEPALFDGDTRVFLALALARRLLADESFDRAELRDLLWNAATRLDDGNLPVAEQELEQARQALEKGLAEGASPQTLAELVERVDAALKRWLEAMAEAGVAAAPPPESRVIGPEELAEMLNGLRDLAETGDRDGLRRRLADLTAMLSELDQAQAGNATGDGGAAKAMAALRDLARRQQDLLDRTFRRVPSLPAETGIEAAEEPPRQPPKPSAAERAEGRREAQAQQALREALRQLGRQLGRDGMPQSLDDAAASMADAATSLGKGDWPRAAELQGDALGQLRDGAREMVEKMAAAHGPPGGVVGRDPFGRSGQGQIHRDDGSTKVQDQSALRRAREILDELRRRAADPRRPEAELDYLRRLLKQF